MDFDAIIPAPFGQIGLKENDNALCEIVFLLHRQTEKSPTTSLLRHAAFQLQAYFKNPDAQFDLPVRVFGTSFQQRVWKALREIPIGHTSTYGELAAIIHSSPRAVGQACGANPLPIMIPCHRVVSASGDGGFMHSRNTGPLGIKQWLLQHERR